MTMSSSSSSSSQEAVAAGWEVVLSEWSRRGSAVLSRFFLRAQSSPVAVGEPYTKDRGGLCFLFSISPVVPRATLSSLGKDPLFLPCRQDTSGRCAALRADAPGAGPAHSLSPNTRAFRPRMRVVSVESNVCAVYACCRVVHWDTLSSERTPASCAPVRIRS